MPSSFARSFMRLVNASSEPEMCSAMATAQSLAELTAMHLSISSTLICSPSLSQIWLPPMELAWALAVTMSLVSSWPLSSCSMMSSSVMIFVTLAGDRCSSAFFSYNTVPVERSIRIADGADIFSSSSVGCSSAIAGVSSSSAASSRQIHRFICSALSVDFSLSPYAGGAWKSSPSLHNLHRLLHTEALRACQDTAHRVANARKARYYRLDGAGT